MAYFKTQKEALCAVFEQMDAYCWKRPFEALDETNFWVRNIPVLLTYDVVNGEFRYGLSRIKDVNSVCEEIHRMQRIQELVDSRNEGIAKQLATDGYRVEYVRPCADSGWSHAGFKGFGASGTVLFQAYSLGQFENWMTRPGKPEALRDTSNDCFCKLMCDLGVHVVYVRGTGFCAYGSKTTASIFLGENIEQAVRWLSERVASWPPRSSVSEGQRHERDTSSSDAT